MCSLFYERDKESPKDEKLILIMHGFKWGMAVMRQIVEGNQ